MADDRPLRRDSFGGHETSARPVSVDDAIAALYAHAQPPKTTRVKLAKAHARVLMEPVIARRDQPPFDAAAMDGYAVAALPGPDETLVVIGESQAGRAFVSSLSQGQAVRVFTGAPLPEGTRRVLVQEDVIRSVARIRLRPEAIIGTKPHIRPRGSDFLAGDQLLAAGDRLDAWKLAVAAATGAVELKVARKPRLVMIASGDELIRPGIAPRPDQIFESNLLALSALSEQWGAVVTTKVRCPDRSEDLYATLTGARADILVTVGGASVGDYDLIRPVLTALGVQWIFENVDMKPGKPTAFGILPDGRRVLCLPGNPGSALICAQLFLKALITASTGALKVEPFQALPCVADLPANGSREAWLRAIVSAGAGGSPILIPLDDQDSSHIATLAITSALIRRRARANASVAGEICECVVVGSSA